MASATQAPNTTVVSFCSVFWFVKVLFWAGLVDTPLAAVAFAARASGLLSHVRRALPLRLGSCGLPLRLGVLFHFCASRRDAPESFVLCARRAATDVALVG